MLEEEGGKVQQQHGSDAASGHSFSHPAKTQLQAGQVKSTGTNPLQFLSCDFITLNVLQNSPHGNFPLWVFLALISNISLPSLGDAVLGSTALAAQVQTTSITCTNIPFFFFFPFSSIHFYRISSGRVGASVWNKGVWMWDSFQQVMEQLLQEKPRVLVPLSIYRDRIKGSNDYTIH